MKDQAGNFTTRPLDTVNLSLDKNFPGLAEDGREPPPAPYDDMDQILDFINIEMLRETIFSFKKYQSPGADGIFPVLLQEGFEILSDFILNLYKDLLSLGIILTEWTINRVVFIPKPGIFHTQLQKILVPLVSLPFY